MHPFVHGDDAVAAAFRRRESRPSCDYGFYAAQGTALEAWHSWVADHGEAARLEQARPARPDDPAAPRRGFAHVVVALRQTIGSILILFGQRVQGLPSTTQLTDTARVAADQP